jgi:hypothetical protein
MEKYFSDLWGILIFFWELWEKVWFWTSPIIVPLILPAWAIYLIRRNKKVFKIPGPIVLVLTLLWAVIWLYMYFRAGNFHFHPSTTEAIKEIPGAFFPLSIFYFGVYVILEKRLWVRIIGLVAALVGFICFCAPIFIGTP